MSDTDAVKTMVQGYGLSPQQERLWTLGQSEGASSYATHVRVEISGTLNPGLLKAAIRQVVKRHEILRTRFHDLPGMMFPIQVITEGSDFLYEDHDLTTCDFGEQEARIEKLSSTMHASSAESSGDLLPHFKLVKVSACRHTWLVNLPLGCADGQTVKNFVQQVSETYTAYFQRKEEPSVAQLQYADFVEWQQVLLEDEEGEIGRTYWKRQNQNITLALQHTLPFERVVKERSYHAYKSISVPISQGIVHHLDAVSTQYGLASSTVLLGCWCIVLQRFTGQDDVLVGVACDGRTHEEMQTALGPYAKYVPMHSTVNQTFRFHTYVKQLQQVVTECEEWQEYFSWKEIDKAVEGSEEMCFPYCFEFDEQCFNYAAPGLSFTIARNNSYIDGFKIRLMCSRQGNAMQAILQYDSSRYQQDMMSCVAGRLTTVLHHVACHPEEVIAGVNMLSEEERHRVLYSFNDSPSVEPEAQGLHRLFERQVERTPKNIAVVYEERSLTYLELNRRANRLAHHLRSQGVGLETTVGVYMERSLELVVALLGILKAGGAYVPIDPSYPQSRVIYMLEDSSASLVLTQKQLRDSLPEMNVLVVSVDCEEATVEEDREYSLPILEEPDSIAYVIYTSGSTGSPKGVLVQHRNAVHSTMARIRYYKVAVSSFLLLSSFAFDSSVAGIFWVLSQGGRLCIPYEGLQKDPSEVGQLIEREQITHVLCLPSFYSLLLEQVPLARLQTLSTVIVAGETCPRELVGRHHECLPLTLLFNEYGPTEGTVWSSVYHSQCLEERAVVPIGQPIADMKIYLLDHQLEPVPIGIPEELHIAGAGLARGYHNRPALTAEKFIPDPFCQEPGARLYKTGDLARYRPDGTIEFIGRRDCQVKIRGYRIELGEIEAHLVDHSTVQDVAVLALASSVDEVQLVGYVVLRDDEQDTVSLREFLAERLPEHMIPTRWVTLKKLPVTPNGKVDRQALPAPDEASSGTGKYAAPRTLTEERLVGIWTEVLGVECVGVHDNFFELGGHSLLATRVMTRLRSVCEVDLLLRTLFEAPTVAQLAETVEAARHERSAVPQLQLMPIAREGPIPLSFAQERLWFLWQMDPEGASYNVSNAVRLKGTLHLETLKRTFDMMVTRHESLRTTFCTIDGRPSQVIREAQPIKIIVKDLSALSKAERETRVMALAEEEEQSPFDLECGPLLRVVLLRLYETEHVLLVTMHHIISDGWSMNVIIEEFVKLYESYRQGAEPQLPVITIQYADYAQWQRRWLEAGELERQLDYWKDRLNNQPPMLDLPTDRSRPSIQRYRGATYKFAVDEELTSKLNALAKENNVTLFMLLLAIFKVLLYRYAGQADILIGVPIANRVRAETEGLIGFFVNALVLRTDLSGNPRFQELLHRVKIGTLEAQEHQDLPFERLVEVINPQRHLAHHPLFQVTYNHQWQKDDALRELTDLQIEGLEYESQVTQFDLTLNTVESTGKLFTSFTYSIDLFNQSSIERISRHWVNLLKGIVENPDACIESLPLLSEDESAQLLKDWNKTDRVWGEGAQSVVELFEAQASRTPEREAVVFGEERMTYAELNTRADRVAQELRALGVGPEVFVGLCFERSVEMVVGVLAVWKAGGAYVPIDPSYPKERTAFILEDAQPTVLLTQQMLLHALPPSQARVLCLDEDGMCSSEGPREITEHPFRAEHNPMQTAYMIYTSGSTGIPKGVLVCHDSALNFLAAMRERLDPTEHDRLLAVTSLSFDISLLELILPLIVGAHVILVDTETTHDGLRLCDVMQASSATMMQATPATWRMLVDVGWQGQAGLQVLCGGEALTAKLAADLSQRSETVWNLYGPTETTVWSTLAPVMEEGGPIPIGRPIANTQVYVLDRHYQPVPIRVVGELYIGGAGLARGYHQKPDLTAERFLPNPFSPQGDDRLYATGDLVRYRANGTLEFIGRQDHQVKLRGYRIELGEIESQLRRHPGITEAVVLAREDRLREQQLVGYVQQARGYQLPEDETTAVQGEHTVQWEKVWQEHYQMSGEEQPDPMFHIGGWRSSYTGEPLPSEEMREWVEGAVNRIASLKPRHVLEIGCGTGLLLFRLAPQCESYWATDCSDQALQHIHKQLERKALPGVTWRQQWADDFTGLEHEAFDTVILNSVIQYFPSVNYLMRVLGGVLRCVKPGGCIFLGDVRHRSLLSLFQFSIEVAQASSSDLTEVVRDRIQKRVLQEEELLLDPAFFTILPQFLSKISGVFIRPKRGKFLNEMTRFRYDVVLQVGPGLSSTVSSLSWVDWKHERLTVAEVGRILRDEQPEVFALQQVPNIRLSREANGLALLMGMDGAKPFHELQDELSESEENGVDPEELWALSNHVPYEVDISWGGSYEEGAYDVVCRRRTGQLKDTSVSRLFPELHEPDPQGCLTNYATNPIEAKVSQRWLTSLQDYLRSHLPEYMIPTKFIVLTEFPLMPNGKVDRKALLEPEGRELAAGRYMAPRTPTEELLAGIWAEILGLERVSIYDNFFDLGGHSLLAVQLTSRIQKMTKITLPLRRFFQIPTVASLADFLANEPSDNSRPLIAFQSDGQCYPLYCMDPTGTHVLSYQLLADSLGAEQPVYGITLSQMFSLSWKEVRLETVAKEHVRIIQEQQPMGPYNLLGWSNGGLIALSMAHILEQQGQSIAFIGILDTPMPFEHPQEENQIEIHELLPYLGDDGKRKFETLPEEQRMHFRESLHKRLDVESQIEFSIQWANEQGFLTQNESDASLQVFKFVYALRRDAVRMIEEYQRRTIHVPIHAWWASETLKKFGKRPIDWKLFTTGEVRTETIDGNHKDVVESSYVHRQIAEILRSLHSLRSDSSLMNVNHVGS
ncbi:MAG: hypothetical protein NPIRA02_40560 [Nitrospirales bacterium]|nr:MAG: hypothetical protein NPIRA02_40560 [Nitrospirales bacterium]